MEQTSACQGRWEKWQRSVSKAERMREAKRLKKLQEQLCDSLKGKVSKDIFLMLLLLRSQHKPL